MRRLGDLLTPGQDSPLAAAFIDTIDRIKASRGRVIVTGMGKSGHIARKIAATLASTGQPASYVHPGEASHGDLGMIGREDVVIALSNSGETPELRDIIGYCSRFGIPLIAITSGADSSLAKASDIILLLPPAREACSETRAPTTTTTMSLVLGDALAVTLLRERSFSAEDFQTYHPGGKLGATLRKVSDLMSARSALPLCAPETRMDAVISEITRHGLGCVGIIDEDGLLVGVITDGDIRRHVSSAMLSEPARSVMTKSPITIAPDSLAAEALHILSSKHITALFVCVERKPVGLLHVHDCLDAGVI
ncbi:KpsF/GutQ [Aquisalinus flavus]|uniref:KpsF/GutQ n=1 Tax=Aquisalinus flavus TaxID=1526572 RepID=A0A8J2V681_9PROT|nr:KpsF/GutQ [Aquisalinus flavus]